MALTQLTLMCPSPKVTWHRYFLIAWQLFYGKTSEIVGELSSPALEMQYDGDY